MSNNHAQKTVGIAINRCRCRGVLPYALLAAASAYLVHSASAYGAAAPTPRISNRNGPSSSPRRSRKARSAIASGGAPSRQYRPVVDAFTKKFGVKVEVSTGNATDTVNRVLAERKAGRYTVDVALISVRENQQRLVPSESVVPFAPLAHPSRSGEHLALVRRQALVRR